ncbi:hypothetical protein BO94DRAFT_627669 [Aspergillus sclerotioniger CBS 115572]|uniref:alpha-galactosidase n=1 Tax=Aspergillus sclerotioniger CBS 115572 TaxID=1450535 RepID=A0A317VGU1_9EURO|nr:hypothetical protein BO94DRAFT_627669 [Aspergillus sclerotioniger CBS 115572]PWY73155.1 hypothetical protein BO94DRAFT_627669 [Aspergillus sclerotioniger CBS 115572]
MHFKLCTLRWALDLAGLQSLYFTSTSSISFDPFIKYDVHYRNQLTLCAKPEIWHPPINSTWQIILPTPLTPRAITPTYQIYDIDLFINDEPIITTLHKSSHKVICYFSAGSYEPHRPDSAHFHASDKGNALPGWDTERWLDTRSPNVRSIMQARLDRAAALGCDGVDPDNVDAFGTDNGLDLSREDAVDYVRFLAAEAHMRGLALGLKNANAIVERVVDVVQWAVNEECASLRECGDLGTLGRAGKPVFHIEYPKGEGVSDGGFVGEEERMTACVFEGSGGFSTVLKNWNLDEWIQGC